jgi:hypothetical protein
MGPRDELDDISGEDIGVYLVSELTWKAEKR